ncbi:MAG: hypothetical protein ACO1Q7_21140 [Gemmatimonas sp.]
METLGRHGVRYVLIGATAARLQGFARVTADADISPSRDTENVTRLAAALRELNARIFVDGLTGGIPFEIDAAMLSRADIWNLITDAGRLDIIYQPLGTQGYDDLKQGAVMFRIREYEVVAASIEDIIRCKRAANRVQDRADIPLLEALLERLTQP